MEARPSSFVLLPLSLYSFLVVSVLVLPPSPCFLPPLWKRWGKEEEENQQEEEERKDRKLTKRLLTEPVSWHSERAPGLAKKRGLSFLLLLLFFFFSFSCLPSFLFLLHLLRRVAIPIGILVVLFALDIMKTMHATLSCSCLCSFLSSLPVCERLVFVLSFCLLA